MLAWFKTLFLQRSFQKHLFKVRKQNCKDQNAVLEGSYYIYLSRVGKYYLKRCCSVGADRKPDQRTFIRLHSAPLTTLMVATYVPPAACSADKGDLFTLLGIMNKQDYARWHSCEFVLGAKTFDPSLRPPGHPEVCMALIATPLLSLSPG